MNDGSLICLASKEQQQQNIPKNNVDVSVRGARCEHDEAGDLHPSSHLVALLLDPNPSNSEESIINPPKNTRHDHSFFQTTFQVKKIEKEELTLKNNEQHVATTRREQDEHCPIH